MKLKLPVLFLALITCIAVSCGPEDSAEPSGKAKITGKWNGVKQSEITHYPDGSTTNGEYIISLPDYFILEFKKDKTFNIDLSLQGMKDQESGYYKIQGSQLTLGGIEDIPEAGTYTYQLTDSTLILSDSGKDTINNQSVTFEEYLYFKR